eukprot:TRINITY_DN6146_c0_g2_i1.p1 TRINITY_DN6146_c0_g2~~TRINITY_DN6146_c0_g2_i1.p1  ORF type:complete len:579 (+),score=71.64 TRINITY_DN6146_c0_g2_i1:44-1738(+)
MKGSATALFNYIDSNKSGKISATEMARAMQEESIKNRLRWPGTSDQLVHLLSGGGSHVTESRLESYFEVLELFSFIDDNNSGRISPYELKRALQKDGVVLKKLGVPAHLSNTLFCQIDTNNSGAISFVEFYRHFTAAPLSKPFKALGNYSQITEALFKRMDKDNSGTITKDEFVDALRNDREIQLELGWPAQMANHLFTFLDSDRSGDVSRKEFALFCKAQWLFNTIDKNRSGYIDAYELGVALANPMLERELNSHASQAKQIFTRMDIDGSGMVKFSEFYRWMANPRGGYTSPAPPKIPENKCDHYKNVKRIGQGSFGDVWLVDHYSGERLIKKVPLLQESESGGSFRERMDEVRREAEMLKQYKHPNIVRYVDSYEEPVSKDRVGIIIITEFCSGGDLRGWMKNRKPVESEVVRLFSQICAAIQYLHHGRLLHRDLKPDNIFLSGKRETPTIKVGDFGLVKQLGKTQNAAATVCGTMPYMAPEILEGKTYGSENDVWALGCILYEMAKCDKRLAFPNIADTVNCNLPSGIPSWCAPTIRGILVANPKNRPSVDRLVTGLLKE